MAGERILVVDDNLTNVKLTTALLSKDGFEVRSAAEALQVIYKYGSDLILMDIQMPEIDGLELTRRLKSDPRTSRVPIVACTAYVLEGTNQEAASVIIGDIFHGRFPTVQEMPERVFS